MKPYLAEIVLTIACLGQTPEGHIYPTTIVSRFEFEYTPKAAEEIFHLVEKHPSVLDGGVLVDET